MKLNRLNKIILLFSIQVTLFFVVNYTQQAVGQSILNDIDNTGIGSEDAEFVPQLLVKFSKPDEVVLSPDNETDIESGTMSAMLQENLQATAKKFTINLNDVIMRSDEPLNDTVDVADVSPQFILKKTYTNFDTAVFELKSELGEPGPFETSELVPASRDELVILNETLNQAQNISGVEAIQPVRIFEASAQPIPAQIKRIGEDSGTLKVGTGTKKVDSNIAILDTGISEHSDLNLVASKSFINNDIKDNCGHGTHVAGIAAAKDNDIGIVGSAPGANLWNLKVLEKKPSGKCSGPETAIIDALNFTLGKPIDVLNLSLGAKCKTTSTLCGAPVYESIINDVISEGKIVVVAAGNEGEDAKDFIPARFDGVITVSAISDSDGLCGGLGSQTSWGPDDEFAPFSNYGTVVDIAAPGVDILSTVPNNKYDLKSGTSMASPLVAGIFASYKAIQPEVEVSTLKNSILAGGNTIETICSGSRGYINGGTNDPFPEPLLYVQNILPGSGTNITPLPPNELRNISAGGNGPLVLNDLRSTLVTDLQIILKELGYDLGNSGPNNDGVDGKFGNRTFDAVVDFQQTHTDLTGTQLTADGKVGKLTAEALNKAAGL